MKKCVLVVLAAIVSLTIPLTENSAAEGPHFLEAGFMYYYFDYDEDTPPLTESTEEGWLPGFHIAYGYQGLKSPIYGQILFEYTDYETDFDGTDQIGTPVKSDTDNELMTWEGTIGYTFRKPGGFKFDLTAYTGLGYRYWERELGGLLPFSEEYSWKYVPAGLRADYQISDKWSCTLDISARFMFDGEIQVNLSEAIPGLNDPEVDLGSKTGYKVLAPFQYRFHKSWSLVVVPWYEYSAIDESDTFLITFAGMPSGIGFEPSSETRQYGINLNVRHFFGKSKKRMGPI